WHKLPLPEGLIRDGLILNPQEVGRTIAALFKSAGVARDNVVVSISGLPFTYRIIPMPVLKPAIVDEAMQRAARKEIPISLDELYLTWQALPDGREEIEYFVVGIPRHHLDTLVETLRIAGITPSLVDLPALALARVAGQEKAILVNMDRDYFDIVVVQDGMPRVLRTLTARGSQATLEDNIRLLADELTRTIAFHESHYPRQPLDRTTPVLLTGEFVTGNPLAIHLLQSEFEFPVEQLAVPLTCPEGFPAGDFGINAGLVLKRMRRQKAAVKHFHDVNINLLAGRVQKKPRAKPPATGKIILWLVVIAAILGLYPVYQNRLELGQEISAKQTELRRLSREYNLATLRKEESDRTEATIQQITNDA
ncbi:MAG: pilus assembly protein PilM, partial [Dehalococcoidia bacterium]|nr:pilus assembly protein PilM [Dehalococcoidia bacterium]